MLLGRGVELVERDFFEERFTKDELRSLIGERQPSEVFSWNSPSFKKLGIAREKLDEEQLLGLMVEEPRLVRRPLIQVGGQIIVGADKKAIEQAFS